MKDIKLQITTPLLQRLLTNAYLDLRTNLIARHLREDSSLNKKSMIEISQSSNGSSILPKRKIQLNWTTEILVAQLHSQSRHFWQIMLQTVICPSPSLNCSGCQTGSSVSQPTMSVHTTNLAGLLKWRWNGEMWHSADSFWGPFIMERKVECEWNNGRIKERADRHM